MFARTSAAWLVVAVPAAAAAAEPLKPTSKWNVDYDVAQCTASRNYGTEDRPLLLILQPSPFGGVMRLLLATKGGFASLAREMPAAVQFDGQPRIKANALKFSSADKRMSIYAINLPTEDFKAPSRSISVSSAGLDRAFALDSVPLVLAELEKCRADLLKMYNADNSRIRTGPSPVKPLSQLYSGRDYPTAALQDRDQGRVAISLLIDETGKVADCSVDGSAGAATLDTMSCYVIQQRASFRPAIGVDGKPVRSVYRQNISWRIRGG